MINWELPHDNVSCPHCGSIETHVSLQLLGLVRYSCTSCKKAFAVNDTDGSKPDDPTDHKASVPAR
jgi:transposase-like protein